MLARIIRNSLIAAVVAAVLVTALAWFLSWDRGPLTGFEEVPEEPLLPELQGSLAGVERLTVGQVNRRLVFQRQEDGWGLAQREGYPVLPGQVDNLLQELAALNRHYVSSAAEPDYREYVLRGPDEGGNATIFDFEGSGELPPRLHVGQPVSLANAPQETFTAARRLDNEAIYIVRGNVQVDVDYRRWIDQEILEVPRTQIYEAEKQGAEERYAFRRQDAETFELVAGAEFESLDEREMANATGGLAPLRFVDVRGADALELNRSQSWQARYRSLDGLVIELTFWRDEQRQLWARVTAETTQAVEPGDDGYREAGPAATDIVEQARRIQADTEGWVYRLSESALQQILAPLPVVALAPDD